MLHVINRTARAARVRLSCSGYMIWDVWVTPMGAALAPGFATQRLTLDARLTDRAHQVVYHSSTAGASAASTVTARLMSMGGAHMFVVDARAQTAAPALHVHNDSNGVLDFVARYPGSPYRLAGAVEPGRTLRITYARLEMVVVQDGLSVLRQLPAAEGTWIIQPPPTAGGFPLVQPASEPLPDTNSLAAGLIRPSMRIPQEETGRHAGFIE